MTAADQDRAETIGYLREQHAAILKRVEHYTTAGNGSPAFVEQLQRDLRGIEATMQALLCCGCGKVTPRG